MANITFLSSHSRFPCRHSRSPAVIPAQAGIHGRYANKALAGRWGSWIPAYAGMTNGFDLFPTLKKGG
jgi:hypothetical protein